MANDGKKVDSTTIQTLINSNIDKIGDHILSSIDLEKSGTINGLYEGRHGLRLYDDNGDMSKIWLDFGQKLGDMVKVYMSANENDIAPLASFSPKGIIEQKQEQDTYEWSKNGKLDQKPQDEFVQPDALKNIESDKKPAESSPEDDIFKDVEIEEGIIATVPPEDEPLEAGKQSKIPEAQKQSIKPEEKKQSTAEDRIEEAPKPTTSDYIVECGDTLTSISREHLEKQGITNPSLAQIQNGIDHIAAANGLNEASVNLIDPGQRLKIPNDLKTDASAALNHKMVDRNADRLAANGANQYARDNDITRSGINAPKIREDFKGASEIEYTVKPGDSLYKLAKQFNPQADPEKFAKEIAQENGIENINKINIGDTLTISAAM